MLVQKSLNFKYKKKSEVTVWHVLFFALVNVSRLLAHFPVSHIVCQVSIQPFYYNPFLFPL